MRQNTGCMCKWITATALSQILTTLPIRADSLSIPTTEPKPQVTGNRSIYMNGVDISSARNKDLRNVQLRVDEYGNIFITAPQYQVIEEDTFTPLSSYRYAAPQPEHVAPAPMPLLSRSAESAKPGETALASPVPTVSGSKGLEQPAAAKAPEPPAAPKVPR